MIPGFVNIGERTNVTGSAKFRELITNEDYEGAEFYCRGRKIELKTGDILLFPSNFMYPHEVKEAKKGVRYSFVSWAF